MTRWTALLAVALDGRIARPDGCVDWLEAFAPEEPHFSAFLAGVDTTLMGRATYDAIADVEPWPYGGKRTVVLTGRPLAPLRPGVEVRSGAAAGVAEALEAEGARHVWIVGGGVVLRDFLAAGKVDTLELALIPLVLGAGRPLVAEGAPTQGFHHVGQRTGPGGVVTLSYRRGP